jgi:hypothetical protein
MNNKETTHLPKKQKQKGSVNTIPNDSNFNPNSPTPTLQNDIAKLKLIDAFKTDINTSALSYVKLTFAIQNLEAKIENKKNNHDACIWPPHILNKIKNLNVDHQKNIGQSLLMDELKHLNEKVSELTTLRSTLKNDLSLKIATDLRLHIDEPLVRSMMDTQKQEIMALWQLKIIQHTSTFTANQLAQAKKTEAKKLKKKEATSNKIDEHSPSKIKTTIKQLVVSELKKLTNNKPTKATKPKGTKPKGEHPQKGEKNKTKVNKKSKLPTKTKPGFRKSGV